MNFFVNSFARLGLSEMPDQNRAWERSNIEDSLLFKEVELESVLGLLQDCPVHDLQDGDTLIHAGQPNHFLYLLLSGRLRIHLKLSLEPLTVLEPGEIVGELSIIDGQPTSAYVVADERCRLLVLNEKTLWSLVESSPVVARNLLFILSRRLRHGNTLIMSTQQIERDYSHFAVIDAVTGLYNRRWVSTTLGRQVDRCKKAGWTLSLLLIDIDHFKKYNDDHGRVAGDRVLETMASTLREKMRPDEMIARYGSDEFIALLPDIDVATALSVGRDVRRAVEEMQVYSLDHKSLPSVTISLAAVQMSDEDTAESLLADLEAALQEPRGKGAN